MNSWRQNTVVSGSNYEKGHFDRGLAKRRNVIGDAFVDSALSHADELTMPMQDFVTRVAWDEIWNREAVADRDRSLINFGIVAR